MSDQSGFALGTPSFLRSMNERTVLELIRRRGPLSRAQVSRDSGLSKPTVSLALSSLLAASLVHEVGRSTGGRGPSAVLYEINPSAGWVVGIDVGRRWLRAANEPFLAFRSDGRCCSDQNHPTTPVCRDRSGGGESAIATSGRTLLAVPRIAAAG